MIVFYIAYMTCYKKGKVISYIVYSCMSKMFMGEHMHYF